MLSDGLVFGEFISEPDMFILSQFKSFLKTEQGQKITEKSFYNQSQALSLLNTRRYLSPSNTLRYLSPPNMLRHSLQ